ncbi:MAG: MoaD/ThiS family protein [Candidatus Asgardarchaeia archaeon]
MVKVTFRVFAILRELIGTNKYTLIVPQGLSIKESLERLARETNERILELIFDESGNLKRTYTILLDGTNIRLLRKGINTKIEKDVTITIFPPVGGGSSFLFFLRFFLLE